MKLEFVKLGLLVDMFKEDGKQDPRWVENVADTVGEEALGVMCKEDLADGKLDEGDVVSEDSDFITRQFSCDELEFNDECFYHFMGSEYEAERFYAAADQVFMCKADETLWVINREDLMDF